MVGVNPDIVNQNTITANATAADIAINFAKAQIGKPYVYGATGPNSYDCSGLVQAAYAAGGIALPRTTYQMLGVGLSITTSNDLQPGDLVFPDAGHVQLYVGPQTIIEAATTGTNVREVKMWGFMTGRRVAEPSGQSTTDIITGAAQSLATSSYQAMISGAEATIPGLSEVITLGTGLKKISDPALWKRIGLGALGGFMVIAGFGIVGRKPIGKAAVAYATDGMSLAASKKGSTPIGTTPD